MKFSRLISTLIAPLLLAACGSIELPKPDAASLVVAQDEERECGQGRVLFPAGEYRAEAVEHGVARCWGSA